MLRDPRPDTSRTTERPLSGLRFDNRYVRELPADAESGLRRRQVSGALFSRIEPTPVRAPRLLAHSPEVATLLGLTPDDIASPDFASVFGGNQLIEGMQPYAANYGGHQFGHWAGQLGDGRAISLGEVVNAAGERWELQLKGAGPTPYSRTADGRAVLRSSIREFLCSEAMHHLGVPTTRALSLVGTGEDVVRDMFYDGRARPEPGAVVCRVAPSFLRFGHFELPASRGDLAVLNRLIDFTIRRDFADIAAQGEVADEGLRARWFAEVCERTARMIAHWMRVGFVHGVMNTDNMSILGLTIDYGPYGWIDNFDADWTPNTTDAEGRRYRYGHQPQIAHWNLTRLANALLPVFSSEAPLVEGLERYAAAYDAAEREHVAAKLGLLACGDRDLDLEYELYGLMQESETDMTVFFRSLSDVNPAAPGLAPLAHAFYDPALRDRQAPRFEAWLARYGARVREDGSDPVVRRRGMNAANPRYVLRNYLAQQAIEQAEAGDTGEIERLLGIMRRPYDDQPGNERYAGLRPDWARQKAGCSMLSCSS